MKRIFAILLLLSGALSLNAATPYSSSKINDNWTVGGKTVSLPFDLSVAGGAVLERTLDLGATDKEDYMALYFESLAGFSRVYLNGHMLGNTANSNLSQTYEITPYLKFDGEDVIKVCFDNEEGAAGIIGDVCLIKKSAYHLIPGGINVTQVMNGNNAELIITTLVENTAHELGEVIVSNTLLEPSGREVATATPMYINAAPRKASKVESGLSIMRPSMWSLASPLFYTLVTRLERNGIVVDEYRTNIGFRTIDYFPSVGFMLNGSPIDVHPIDFSQAFPLVGEGVPAELERYLLTELKKGGCTMVSTGGKPASESMLDICDEIGLLVVDQMPWSGLSASQKAVAEELAVRASGHPSVVYLNAGKDATMEEAIAFSEYLKGIGFNGKTMFLGEQNGTWQQYNPDMMGYKPFAPEIGYAQLAEWSFSPVIYMDPQWSFAGKEGQKVTLTVYSNCERVNLGVNGGKYSSKEMVDGKAQWDVEYRPGKVELSGYNGKKMVLKKTVSTTGFGYQIKGTADKLTLRPDGEDVIVIDVQMLDMNEMPTPDANMDIRVYVDDNALNAYGLAGDTSNAKFASVEVLGKEGPEATFRVVDGKARIVLRSVKGSSGIAHVRIGGNSLHGASFNINYR